MAKSKKVFCKDELELWLVQKIQDRSRELLRYLDLLRSVKSIPKEPAEADDDA